MFKKDNILEFLNFKTLITEVVLKWIYIVLSALGIIGTFIAILVSWFGAFTALGMIGNHFATAFGLFILGFLVTPVGLLIGLAVSLLFLRIGFESLLIRFLTYRELKQVNSKVKE